MAKHSRFTLFGIRLWKERRYLDAWSVNHFLAGVLSAALFAMLGLALVWAGVLALVLFILWEVFEYATDAGEARPNQVLDVAVDSAGFALGWLLWSAGLLDAVVFGVLAAVFVVLLTWAYVFKLRYDLQYRGQKDS